MSARKYTLDEIWNIAVRHRWLLLIPVAIGLAAAPLLSRFAPLRYRSEALILVVPPLVSDDFVPRAEEDEVEDRLPGITAQILSRSRLEQIILDMDLYKEERSRQVMEDVVERMRLRDVETSATGKDIDSFRVSYVNGDPNIAQQVTERLTALYVEQNTRDRASQAENTSKLLESALENTKQRLSEQEKIIEAYRKAHAGQLPTQLEGNLHAIQGARMELQDLNEATNRARENRLRVVSELDALDNFVQLRASTPDPSAPASTADLLEAARANLAIAQERFQPGHPDLRDAERLVAELKTKLENEAPLSAKTSAKPLTPAEAERQKRRATLQAELEITEQQLKQYAMQDAQLKRLINSYQAKVDVLPTRESELQELTREYAALSKSYDDLLLKKETASLSANAERRKIGEQFKVLDPASRPEKPYNIVQRRAVLASGALGGLVLAILVLGVREIRDSSFRSKDEVVQALSLPVLASIPVMASDREREVAVRRKWVMDIAGSAALLAAIAVVMVWRLYS